MKNKIRILFVAALLFMSGCAEKEISFQSEQLTVFVGDLFDLDYSTNINKEQIDEIRLEFDDGSLVDVTDDGKLQAVKEGNLVASIIYKDKTYDTEEITIEPVICESIDCSDLVVEIGREKQIDLEYFPENCTHKNFELKCNDDGILKVQGNTVKGISEGETSFLIHSIDGPETIVYVSVVPVKAESISIRNLQSKYVTGNEAVLSADFKPADTTDQNIVWSSSDSYIASIDQNGKLTAIRPGTVYISAENKDGISQTKEVQISYPKVSAVSLSANYSSIYVDDRLGVKAKIEPDKVDDDSLTWSSSNTRIATVDERGVVTALAEGTVTIYAASANGKKGSYKIEISKRPVITRSSTSSASEGSRSGGGGSGSYCLNLNTKKFHRASCGDINKMKESNKQYTDEDRDTIISWGYSPCGHCHP